MERAPVDWVRSRLRSWVDDETQLRRPTGGSMISGSSASFLAQWSCAVLESSLRERDRYRTAETIGFEVGSVSVSE